MLQRNTDAITSYFPASPCADGSLINISWHNVSATNDACVFMCIFLSFNFGELLIIIKILKHLKLY